MSDGIELTDEEILELCNQAGIVDKKTERRVSDTLLNRCPWLSWQNVTALARAALAEMKLIEAEKHRDYEKPPNYSAQPARLR